MKASINTTITYVIGILILLALIVVSVTIALNVNSQGNQQSAEVTILQHCSDWDDCDPSLIDTVSIETADGTYVPMSYLCRQAFGDNYLQGCTSRCCPAKVWRA